jgi:hypothetical protein
LYPAPRKFLYKTYDVAIATNSEGVVFLNSELNGPAIFEADQFSSVQDGLENVSNVPAGTIDIPVGGVGTYRMTVKTLGPFGMLTLFLGSLKTRVTLVGDPQPPGFLASNLSTVVESAKYQDQVDLPSTVVTNTWLFHPRENLDFPDVVRDGSNVILAGAPFTLGELTILLVEPDRLTEIVSHAAESLLEYSKLERPQASEDETNVQ